MVDKALIKDNFKIHHHYVQNYVAISTTNAGEIATKAIKHLEPQTVKLNTFLTRRTDKHNTNNIRFLIGYNNIEQIIDNVYMK